MSEPESWTSLTRLQRECERLSYDLCNPISYVVLPKERGYPLSTDAVIAAMEQVGGIAKAALSMIAILDELLHETREAEKEADGE